MSVVQRMVAVALGEMDIRLRFSVCMGVLWTTSLKVQHSPRYRRDLALAALPHLAACLQIVTTERGSGHGHIVGLSMGHSAVHLKLL